MRKEGIEIEEGKKRIKRKLLIFFLIISIIICTIGYFIYKNNNGDNSKYIGTWLDEREDSELEILKIEDSQITFSWTIYRLATIDDTVIPIEKNKAEFYFQGYDDKNDNFKDDEGEHYYRKVIIELGNKLINIKVKNVTSSEYDIAKEIYLYGGVYIDGGSYTYTIK